LCSTGEAFRSAQPYSRTTSNDRFGNPRLNKGGCILLSVHADDSKWIQKAKEILEQTGADDISSNGETKGDYVNTNKPRDRMSA
jgi:hypothetical protein